MADLLGVHAEGLRNRFSEIFSDPLIAVRELLQNSIEAVRRSDVESPRIDVEIDNRAQTLRVRDNGVGMDAETARRALSQFFNSGWDREARPDTGGDIGVLAANAERLGVGEALSRTRAIVEGLKDETIDRAPSAAIGRYGVGLTTTLMIGDRVTVETRPAKAPSSRHHLFISEDPDDEGMVHYARDGQPSSEMSIGTVVQVAISPLLRTVLIARHGCDLFNPTEIASRIEAYALLAAVPIYLNGRLVVGGNPDAYGLTSDLRDRFDEVADRNNLTMPMTIERHSEEGYCRAIIGVLSNEADQPVLEVWSRGICVGTLRSGLFVGDHVDFIGGVLDSDLFDLQFDRNQPEVNDRLRVFQDEFQNWIADAMAAAADKDGNQYRRLINVHRATMLIWMLQNEGVAHRVGGAMPFAVAQGGGGKTRVRALEQIVASTLEIDGKRYLPFVTPRIREAEMAATFFSARGTPLVHCDKYLRTSSGEMNVDLHFLGYYLSVLHDGEVRPERADRLLGEVLSNSSVVAGQEEIRVWLEQPVRHIANLKLVSAEAMEQPLFIAISESAVDHSERPAARDHNPLLAMLRTFSEEQEDGDFARLLKEFEEERARATIFLNVSHPKIEALLSSAEGGGSGGPALRALVTAASFTLLGEGEMKTLAWSMLVDQLADVLHHCQ